ncbi:MAG: hypothetical protein AAB596_01185 [Patescibacteria group bacterium]
MEETLFAVLIVLFVMIAGMAALVIKTAKGGSSSRSYNPTLEEQLDSCCIGFERATTGGLSPPGEGTGLFVFTKKLKSDKSPETGMIKYG